MLGYGPISSNAFKFRVQKNRDSLFLSFRFVVFRLILDRNGILFICMYLRTRDYRYSSNISYCYKITRKEILQSV